MTSLKDSDSKDAITKKDHFLDCEAFNKLTQLAEDPFDLTVKDNITPERLRKYTAESCGYKFFYGTERITDDVLNGLQELAAERDVIAKMQKMQQGEITNFIHNFPSENRPALHTAVRDFFLQPQAAKEAQAATALAQKEIDKLKHFIEKIDNEKKFNQLIFVAIGGSDLGPEATYLALEVKKKAGRAVHFISNVDPDNAAAVLRNADLPHSLVLVVSKSGSTLETAANEDFVRSYFEKAGLKPKDHFVAITGKDSPLDNPNKYLESFYIWDWIGGRFSTTSMVGGVLISFMCGFDVYWELLRGANAMDKSALINDTKKNLPLLGALLGIWNHNFLNYPTLAIIPYSHGLMRYAAHIQQVDMESNGKRVDQYGRNVPFETGPIIWGEPGTNAQHSFFQLIHQGTAVVPVEYIGFKESQYGADNIYKNSSSQEKLLANLFAQALALATGKSNENPNKIFPGNRPSHMLLAKQLTPFAVGALIAYYEHKIAFQGFIWGINSFDQEGVQLGKELANRIIDRFIAARSTLNGESYPLGDFFIDQLNEL